VISPIQDPIFGLLTWDSRIAHWKGEFAWLDGARVRFLIQAEGLQAARSSLTWLRENEETARRCVSGKMLDRCNRDCSEEDEPMTEQEFLRRIRLTELSFEKDGAMELYYDDDGLFLGHAILAIFEPDRSFRDAGLMG
jgi:hypothetical protein